jgi:hypothetical protein
MAVTQVFGLLCIVVAICHWQRRRERIGAPAPDHALFQENAYL